MFETLQFVMVSCLFANLVAFRGTQVWAWLKTEVGVVESKL